ncbi:MAG: hypothetical protein V4529_17250 [Gemmatimonadota bacterium]
MVDTFQDAHVEALHHVELANANFDLRAEAIAMRNAARDRGDHVAAVRWHSMALLYQEAGEDMLAIATMAQEKMQAELSAAAA